MENTATPTVTPSSVGLRYGVLTGIVSIIFSLIMFATNSEESPLKYVSYIISIAAIVLAHQYFKRHNNGFMSFGQGVSIGTILSVVSGVLGAIFIYIYATVIDTNFTTRLLENARTKMEADGTSPEQVDQAMAMTSKFMTGPSMALFAVLGALIGGLILSLIISAITKRNQPEFE
ncbi:DUF4199 domain-containing protein [Hymenobacter sp. B81]|uniref:DUF4199 domain-containing protein n=1 Tax=Hymenobacter sp. B81 TaxID=3344878 RepID=UPI0037DC19D8